MILQQLRPRLLIKPSCLTIPGIAKRCALTPPRLEGKDKDATATSSSSDCVEAVNLHISVQNDELGQWPQFFWELFDNWTHLNLSE
jgi:hypothetical protein